LGANVIAIARLGDDLEKLPMPRRFSDRWVCPLTKIATAVG